MSSSRAPVSVRTLVVVLACLSWVPVDAQVSGPSQSTDNAAARWDGTTGDQLQDSKLIIGDDGQVNEIRFAEAFAPSPTGGVQEAINNCGVGLDTVGCIVVLPRGVVNITKTITVGFDENPLTSDGKSGVVLMGHGSGQETFPNHDWLGGTTLRWACTTACPDPAVVLKIKSVSLSKLSNFAIDGDSEADV